MADLDILAQATTKATALNNLILVTPKKNIGYQPQNPKSNDSGISEQTKQPDAFLFDYEGDQSVTLKSNITDHYVEDNTTLQDQIALAPEMIKVSGFIGELTNTPPKDLLALRNTATRLYTVSAFTPELSIAALQAYNAAKLIYDVAKQTKNAAVQGWASVTGGSTTPTQTKQQIAFATFYGYWRSRTLFTIQTPWRIFEDCAIDTLTASQNGDTELITDFEITFKQMRFADTQTLTKEQFDILNYINAEGRTFNQGYPEINIGPNTPVGAQDLSGELALA